MKKELLITILFSVFFLFLAGSVSAYCEAVPVGENYTVTVDCTFEGTVNGVDNGNLYIGDGISTTTLTINAGQTIVWNPGYSVIIRDKASIAINKGSPGGQLKKTLLWAVNSDLDGYYIYQAQDSQPTGGVRRYSITGTQVISYVDSDQDGYCLNSTPSCVAPGTPGYTSSCTAYSDCADSNANIFQNISSLVTDSDHDGWSTGTAAAQCVGSSTTTGGRTYYKDSSGNYTWLPSSSSSGSDCDDTTSTKYQNLSCYPDADNDTYYANTTSSLCCGSACGSGCVATSTAGTDCDDSSSTITTATNWGQAVPGCTGSNQRCYLGSCKTCDGYLYSDGCSGCAGQGGNACWRRASANNQSCDTVCSSYGGCVAANWNDTSCAVSMHWVSCNGGCATTVWEPSSFYDTPNGGWYWYCYVRDAVHNQYCTDGYYWRVCVCQY